MRLLLVEDEERLADALAHILKKNGYETDVSYEGETGLDNALSGIYDVIILDRMLPLMNGMDILRKIRESGMTTPVIFLTAVDGTSEKVRGLDLGADDYLVKPFSSEELMARIRALSRRKDKDLHDESYLSAGSLRYEPGTLTASYGDSEVKFTFKEGQLFEYLLSNKGISMSKEKIYEKIWGFEGESDISIIEIYIHHLRKKVQTLNCDVEIETIRGIGYRLKEGINV